MGYTRRERLRARRAAAGRPADDRGHPARDASRRSAWRRWSRSSGDSFGGLGQLITEGLQTFFPTKIYLGAVPVGRRSRSAPTCSSSGWSAVITPWAHAEAGRALMDGIVDFFLTDPANWTGATGIPNRCSST